MPRTKIIEQTYYKFDELSIEAKSYALEKLWDLNVDNDWWDTTFDDANDAGLEILDFHLEYNQINGKLTHDASDSIKSILKNHGKECETYKLAKKFKRLSRIAKFTATLLGDDDENGEETYLDELCNAYLRILKSEYEYLTSEAGVIETIKCNDYDFDENGELL